MYSIVSVIVLCSLFYFLFPRNAYAYIDLGSGSYVFQLIIASLLGLLFTIKIYWKKIVNLLVNFFSKKRPSKK